MISEGYKEYAKEQINEYILKNNKLPNKNDIKNIIMEPLIGEYGSWKNILIDFGFLRDIKNDDIFNLLLELQLVLKRPLTMVDIRKEKINIRPLLKQYGSWSKLKNELITYLPEDYQKNKISINEKLLNKVLEEEMKLKILTEKENKIPTANSARNSGININRLLLKYKTWNNTKKELKLEEIIKS